MVDFPKIGAAVAARLNITGEDLPKLVGKTAEASKKFCADDLEILGQAETMIIGVDEAQAKLVSCLESQAAAFKRLAGIGAAAAPPAPPANPNASTAFRLAYSALQADGDLSKVSTPRVKVALEKITEAMIQGAAGATKDLSDGLKGRLANVKNVPAELKADVDRVRGYYGMGPSAAATPTPTPSPDPAPVRSDPPPPGESTPLKDRKWSIEVSYEGRFALNRFGINTTEAGDSAGHEWGYGGDENSDTLGWIHGASITFQKSIAALDDAGDWQFRLGGTLRASFGTIAGVNLKDDTKSLYYDALKATNDAAKWYVMTGGAGLVGSISYRNYVDFYAQLGLLYYKRTAKDAGADFDTGGIEQTPITAGTFDAERIGFFAKLGVMGWIPVSDVFQIGAGVHFMAEGPFKDDHTGSPLSYVIDSTMLGVGADAALKFSY